ncbi:hypothetical protein ACFUCV_03065 [Specibacter sp. NPDC057265]|uniref:hypothetical protein n=1 Tax=Specibacter sp. NPDC057265 TaxID=3346075 RepID=UPI00362F5CA0
MARKHLKLPSYKLSHVATALGLADFKHHDAGDDALACAHVAIALARSTQLFSLASLWPVVPGSGFRHSGSAGLLRRLSELPAANREANPYGPLFGQTMVFSRDVEGMSRGQAQDAAAARGATLANNVTRKVSMLVCADPASGAPSAKLLRARQLVAAGQDIEIIGGPAFRRLLAFK